MLHAPLLPTAAKLDISRLLESSPSPQSRAALPSAQQQAQHAARSASDPPPTRPLLPGSERSSISSTHSSSNSYAALSASSLPPQLPPANPHQPAYSQHHRPRIPSMSALPLPGPTLPPVEAPNARPALHALSTSSLPDPASFSYPHPLKRPAPNEPHPSASPAKRQSKWTAEEDSLVIELRGAGMKWEDISKRIPGRTPLSCRLHYQNYIERRSQWDEDRKNRLARLYERLKPEMWKPLAAELNVPWRAAEAMHWQLGQAEMARRAGVTPFSISGGSATGPAGPPSGSRFETQQLMEGSPNTGYPPPSPYTGPPYGTSSYAQQQQQPLMRQGYFDDRIGGGVPGGGGGGGPGSEPSFRTPAYGRPRSISGSSGGEDTRRGSGSMSGTGSSWSGPPAPGPSDRRYGSESWPLPRLPEVEDQAASHGATGPAQQQLHHPAVPARTET